MKPLIVLAGGFGTRLRSLVSDVPKPLAPVCGKPFLVYLIEHWMRQGVSEFIFLLHYEAEKINRLLEELSGFQNFSNLSFRTIKESTPLGTGGAILNAINHFCIEDGFLVANADTWLGSGIEKLSTSTTCAIGAVHVQNSERFGSLDIKDGKVCVFKEKSSCVGSGYINSGLYHLLPEIFQGFEVGSAFGLEQEVFPKLVNEGQLGVIKLKSSFIDIGIPEDYLEFCKWVKSGKLDEI